MSEVPTTTDHPRNELRDLQPPNSVDENQNQPNGPVDYYGQEPSSANGPTETPTYDAAAD